MKRVKKEYGWHAGFWILVVLILTLIFGRSWGSRTNALYFVSMLLPVVMATSYFFNYFLVPRYLLNKKYFFFGLYFLYTIVISLYLEIIVLMLSFIYLANFDLGNMGPYSRDTLVLGIVMYMIVFFGSFLLLIRQYYEREREIRELSQEKDKMKKGMLEVMSNRQMLRLPFEEILYIESLADYIKINCTENRNFSSKEKISKLQESLPEIFIRIHRSFIVNTEKVSSFNYDEVEIGDIRLNIGRSYKKDALKILRNENNEDNN